MASKLFFDPLVLLRVAPLITSTASLMFAADEHFFLTKFLAPEDREKSNAILPGWFSRMFHSGVIIVIGLNTLTTGTSIANLVFKSESLASTGRQFYTAGLAFGLAHYLFVPIIAYPIRDIVEDRSHGESTKDLKKWIDINLLRTLTVDLSCWASFFAAVLTTLHV
ncbi:hypothetical protein BP6252_07581 [Coleophoma cylindrospora]|uniref:Integral membrane protein n=1 Tax=Coleophoma cylindrospora TaxID=1849047 RepID=A0A3D8RAS2_9HELO|nr:hypothetical protein BP6252_07581 [Coleophoma cylindrospora]